MSFNLAINGCESVLSPEVLSNRKNLDKIIDKFNGLARTSKMYGEIQSVEDQSPATRALDRFVKDIDPALAFDETFILTKGQLRRLEIRLDQHERQMGNRLGYLESLYKLPHAIMRKTPAGADFIYSIDQAKNYERNNTINLNNKMKAVSKYFRRAFLDFGIEQGFWDKTTSKRLVELENDLSRNSNQPDKVQEITNKINDIVDGGDGRVFRDFTYLTKLDNKSFAQAVKDGVNDSADASRFGEIYNPNIVKAAETARQLLKDLGSVNFAALDQLRDAVWMKVTGLSHADGRDMANFNSYLKNFDKSISEAKIRLKKGMKEGGYFPEVAIGDVMELKAKGDRIISEQNNIAIEKLIDDFTVDLDSMVQLDLPANVKARNDLVNMNWSKNPLYVLSEYGQQAIQFNKLNTIANSYGKILQVITKSGVDAQYLEGLGNFLHDEYTIATKGLANRPASVNKFIRTVKVVETLKAMSLGVPGAIRNVAGMQFFLVNMGKKRIQEANLMYKTGVYENDSVQRIVNAIAQKQGFDFGDLGAELVSDGIIAKDQADQLDFRFNVEKGRIEVKKKDTPVWDWIENVQEYTVKKGLTLHTLGENFIRKHMYRLALVETLETYRNQPEYWAKFGGHNLTANNWQGNKLAQKASKQALFLVNQMAGEYALHAKSRLLTGVPGKLSKKSKLLNPVETGLTAVTSLATGLLHYPMFITDMQYKKAEGAIHGLAGGEIGTRQIYSPEAQYFAKYASFYAFIQLMSAMFNSDLNRLFENDTIDRIAELSREVSGPSPEDLNANGTLKDSARGYYGILGQVTGPLVDDLAFGMMATGLVNMPDDWFSRTIFGYDRLLEDSGADAKERAYWNRMGTAFGFFGNKVVPAMRDGRGLDIIAHSVGLWPSSWTKTSREYINKFTSSFTPFKPFKTGKKKKVKTWSESQQAKSYHNKPASPIDALEKQLRELNNMTNF